LILELLLLGDAPVARLIEREKLAEATGLRRSLACR
jgi:hypothetical protein